MLVLLLGAAVLTTLAAFDLYEVVVPPTHGPDRTLRVAAGGTTVALTLPPQAHAGALVGFALAADGTVLRAAVVRQTTETAPAARPAAVPELSASTPNRTPTERGHSYAELLENPRPWRSSVCRAGVPQWLAEELENDSDRPDHLLESVEDARRRCASGAGHASSVPEQPGNYEGTPVQIPRMASDATTTSRFFIDHVSTGLPVVLVGARGNTSESAARWERRRLAIRADREARLLDPTHNIGRCTAEGCERVHLCADGCFGSASMQEGDVPEVFTFDGAVMAADRFGPPEVFSGSTGQRFGGPLHFDANCDGSISMQYDGVKRWSLWSPWDIADPSQPGVIYPAHTRFETVLREGDILFFAPGFFHGTHILEGPSVAAVYYFVTPPVYGSTNSSIYLSHPLGLAPCLWERKSAQWRALMASKGRREDGSPARLDR